MNTNIKISVIICTHNPNEKYLKRTLDALRAQTLDRSKWELVLIDNRSELAVEGRFDVSWHPHGKVILEEELGLTPARMRGIRESYGKILCYVDDDNVLDPEYLQQALTIGTNRPELGCWGGEITGEFETPPPPWFKGYEYMLVIRPLMCDTWGNAYRYDDAAPCGAGLCVRSTVVDHYVRLCDESPLRRTLGRCGSSTMSGEDIDLAFTGLDIGMGMGRFKALQLLHLIPTKRLELDYILRLAEGMAESDVYLEFLRIRDHSQLTERQSRRQQFLYWVEWLKSLKQKRLIMNAQAKGRKRAFRRIREIM